MPDRRSFIKTSLLAGGLPIAAVLPMAHADGTTIRTLVDPTCSDARAFARAHGTTASTLDRVYHDGAFVAAHAQCWFGLTRDSDYFIMTQRAAEHGYRAGYVGVHDYRDGSLRHTLRGARQLLVLLGAAITAAPARWPQILAHALPLLAASDHADQHLNLRSAITRPADSGGYLVSWCLRRA
jgi:hypothetical protein